MGSFEYDGENWWFNVVGKGNKAAKISVRDECIEAYLKRYRTTLSLSPLPSYKESDTRAPTLSALFKLPCACAAPHLCRVSPVAVHASAAERSPKSV